MKVICRRVQPCDQISLNQVRPTAGSLQCANGHEQRCREVVGKLLHAIAAGLPGFFRVLWRHGVPGEEVKQLVGQVEVTPPGDFAVCDQHRVQFRQTAGCA